MASVEYALLNNSGFSNDQCFPHTCLPFTYRYAISIGYKASVFQLNFINVKK